MSETYFSKFPIIDYNGQNTRDISRRTKILNLPAVIPTNFAPYEVIENMRPDVIADQYYNDATLDWMIYFVNNIVDPYYGWPLNPDEFNDYIVKKYGSIDFAQQLVAAFRTNWPSDDTNLTVSYYNSLPATIAKYYGPIWGVGSNIIGYTRRQEDWFVSTNKIVSLNVTMSSNSVFSNGELLIASSGGQDVGRAECVIANSSVMTIQNVLDHVDNGATIRSRANNAVNAVITSQTTIIQNIPLTEASFWEPVYWYDVEAENNQSRRFIDLLDPSFVLETAENIRKKLNE